MQSIKPMQWMHPRMNEQSAFRQTIPGKASESRPRSIAAAVAIATLTAINAPFALQAQAVERNTPPVPSSSASESLPLRIEALCSLYSKYEVCHPVVKEKSISANFPTEFLQLSAEDIIEVNIYDARRTEFNYILGSASTIIFGPYGLLGLLAMRRIGDVDFGFTYRDGAKKRTAFIRFKNNRSVERFGNAIKPLLKAIDAQRVNPSKASSAAP